MDKQINSDGKTLEVIWTRNSTRGLNLLPEMKEINIDDTVVKVKKSSKFNVNGVERANRRVKRSLFKEKEKEEVYTFTNTNKLNKKNHEFGNNITSFKKMSDSFAGACKISRARSPQIVSNREKLEKNNDTLFRHLEPRLFPTENLKTVEFSPPRRNSIHNNCATSLKERSNSLSNVSQISCRKSPQISSNREKVERNHDTSFHNLNHHLFPTERVKGKELSTLHKNNSTHGLKLLPEMKEINIDDCILNVKNSSKSDHSIHDIKMNENSVKFTDKCARRSLFQENKKVSTTNKSKKRQREHNNYVLNARKSSTDLSDTSKMSCPRSPQIESNEKKLGRNQNTSFNNLETHIFPIESSKTTEFSSPHKYSTNKNCITSLRKRCDSLSEVSQISCRKSPQISSNRERLERNHDTSFHNLDHNLFPTERVKTNELSTLHTNNSTQGLKLLPEINDTNIDDCVLNDKNSSKSDNSIHDIKMNENSVKLTKKCARRSLFQENKKVSTTNKSKKRQLEHNDYVIKVRKSSTDLSDTSKMSCPRSPQIESNEEKLGRNQNTSFNNLETHVFPTESSKTVEFSSPHKNSTNKNCITSIRKRCDSLSEISEISCRKSPQISSNREKLERNHDTSFHNLDHHLFSTARVKTNKLSTLHKNNSTRGLKLLPEMKEINIDDGVLNAKHSSKSDNSIHDIKMNENNVKLTDKCARRSLFQENKKVSTTNKSKKRQREPYNYVINVRKTSNDLSETSKMSHRKSPQIVSNREKLERNHDTSFHNLDIHLDPSNTSIIKASYIADKISPLCTRDIRGTKSPEIMSSRKMAIKHKNFNKIDVSNYDKCKANDNSTTQVANKNFENENTLSKALLKINSVDSEDIIESSEVIIPQKIHKTKNNKIHSNKKKKKKDCTDESQILDQNKHKNKTEIVKTNESELCSEIKYDSLDIINTENILKSPIIELKIKHNRKKPKLEMLGNQNLENFFKINDDIQKHQIDTVASSSEFKEFAGEKIKDNLKMFKSYGTESLKQNTNKNLSFIHSKVSVILATPEPEVKIADNLAAEYSSETILQKHSYVPIIEVDQSPKTQHINDVLIQSVQSPTNATILPTLFESLHSPTPTMSDNSELPFKIDSVESPCTVYETKNLISPEMYRKKLDNSPSPNHFDSAKKRKKVCKNGLRGKFRDLINRKKSEARIREYEKDLSKNYQPKQCESALLNIIEAWKEFQTFVLLCYHMKSDTEVQKVLVTLDSCPKNATKNSIIRIYSPWLTIESKTTGILFYVGVIHADVIEFSGSTKPFGPTQGLSTNFNELSTTVFQSETIWKCSCSEEVACQCLGEQSVYNYLQYMISH